MKLLTYYYKLLTISMHGKSSWIQQPCGTTLDKPFGVNFNVDALAYNNIQQMQVLQFFDADNLALYGEAFADKKQMAVFWKSLKVQWAKKMFSIDTGL